MSNKTEDHRTERITALKETAGVDDAKLVAVPGFKLSVPVEVRFRDTDAMGHVNNAVYLTYCEIARAHYWKFLFGTRDYREVGFILARNQMDYRSPAQSGDTLLVGIRVSALSRSSFTMEYQLRDRDAGTVIAEGESILVMYDYAARKSIPLADDIRKTIKRFEGLK